MALASAGAFLCQFLKWHKAHVLAIWTKYNNNMERGTSLLTHVTTDYTMALTHLTTEQITAVILDAIKNGLSREVSNPIELAELYGYDTTGRTGAVANRFMKVGQRINTDAEFDVIGLNFPRFTQLNGYRAYA